MRYEKFAFGLILGLMSLLPQAEALELKLKVADDGTMARKDAPITSGIPFERGAVKDLARLSLSADGKALPAQFTLLAPWDDGSVRWALLDTQVDVAAGASRELLLRDDGRNGAPAAPVTVKEDARGVTLASGGMAVILERGNSQFLRVLLDGQERLGAPGRGIVLHTAGDAREVEVKRGSRTVKKIEYSGGGEVVANAPDSIVVEQRGPMRAVVALRGKFPDNVHNGLLSYCARVTLLAGQRYLKVHLWIENNGAMGYYRQNNRNPEPRTAQMEWFVFDGLAFEIAPKIGAATIACEGVETAAQPFKIYQTCLAAKESVRLKPPKYDPFTMEDFEYKITGGSEEIKHGERSDGIVNLKGNGAALTVAVRDFWQNYDKAIEYNNDRLSLWLWPTESQWPRTRDYVSQGFEYAINDDEMARAHHNGLIYLQGGVHKGHEFILDLSGRAPAAAEADLSRPLFALAAPQYYATSDSLPALFAPPGVVKLGDSEADEKLNAWETMHLSLVDRESSNGFYAARRQAVWSQVNYFGDTTYWYGWMDFGDIPRPGFGPSSLQQDWTEIMLLDALRSGKPEYLRFGSEMARHRIDIDQFWSDRDLPEVNGLQRGTLNYPAFHSYRLQAIPGVGNNFLSGMVLYYLMTGEPKALEASKRNAEGLKRAWNYIRTAKPYAGPQYNMEAQGWTIRGYCAMNILTGEQSWLDDALALFRTNMIPKWKEFGPHLHERQQIRSQDYTEDDIKYCYAIENICLLHHLTGDADLLKLIDEGCEKEFPENYYMAPLYLAGLHSYGALVTGKAEYADDAIEHWIEGSPEADCPPVFRPDSSTWAREKAEHLRAGHLLQYGFWKRAAKP